jgi:very-short-patch-repair endonuclease
MASALPNPSPLAGEGRLSGAERGEGLTLSERAKYMRANPTEAERRLWTMLRDRRLASFKFRRQVVIPPYIVDFICLERRLIVEADGSQHAESDYDAHRDAFLRAEGFEVLRFWNNDILRNAQGVFEAIDAALKAPHPARLSASRPSPARGEGLVKEGR